jgi:hypothetical protein
MIGPVTAETAGRLGVNIDIQAEEQSIDGLVKAIMLLAGTGLSGTGLAGNGAGASGP